MSAWTPSDTAEFARLFPETPLRELMRVFGRSKDSILSKGASLGLAKSPRFLASGNSGRTGAPSKKRDAFVKMGEPLFLRPTGASLKELVAFTGVPNMNARGFLYKASRDGVLFRAGVFAHARYFLTAEAAAAGVPLLAAESAARRKTYVAARLQAERERTAKRRAESDAPKRGSRDLWSMEHTQLLRDFYPTHGAVFVAVAVGRSRPSVLHKAGTLQVKCLVNVLALNARPKVVKPKKPKPPKVAKVRPTVPEKPKPGPANRSGKADESRAIRTIAPRAPERFEIPADFRGPFSLVGIGRDPMTGRAWA